MVDVYAELLLGGQDVEDGGDKISPVVERGFGAVAHIGAVGQAVEVEHIARLAQDVVEIAVGASHVLLEVARRNGYAGDLAPQGKFLVGEGAGGGERIGGGLYIYGAVEEVVGRACYGVGYPSLGLVDERHEGRLQVVALPQCGQCLAALPAVALCHQFQDVVSGIVQRDKFRKGGVEGVEQVFVFVENIERDVLYSLAAKRAAVGVEGLYLQGKSGDVGRRTARKVVLDAACRYKCHKKQYRQYLQAVTEFVLLHDWVGVLIVKRKYCNMKGGSGRRPAFLHILVRDKNNFYGYF